MILLRDDLQVVPDAIRLARATFRTIRRNLAWAFCYNLAALPLAALGLLNPLVAAAAIDPVVGLRGVEQPAPAAFPRRTPSSAGRHDQPLLELSAAPTGCTSMNSFPSGARIT